jgi:glycolate oxidase iron-sulfur subunit
MTEQTGRGPEGSGEPQGGAPVDREGSGEPQGGAQEHREPAHERASATQVGARGPEGLPDEVGADPGQADRATAGAGRPEAGVAVLPAFDDHHPPEQELIDDCVHCGFCLPLRGVLQVAPP